MSNTIYRVRIAIHGAVQGVGFRPFVYRLAGDLGLAGWVNNTAAGVFIEAEGTHASLERFVSRLESEKPPASFIQSLETTYLDHVGYKGFTIVTSDGSGPKTTVILPDLATCPDCLRELFDPGNRRYRYPFINCTNCGPRFSIINDLPYDRPNTAMAGFPQCRECAAEYHDPGDRRFHAQPNACPKCGPHLELWTTEGWTLACGDNALQSAAAAISAGRIVAVKGLGGYQLLCDPRNQDVVNELRKRKHREEKPLAVMYPNLTAVYEECVVSDREARLLSSMQSPIVLLERKPECHDPSADGGIAEAVAPGNPYLGVMLPYTPMHHLLMAELGFPVVATSGNLTDEPICIDDRDALARLSAVADVLLVHDRPIARHVDDSVVRVVMGRELVLRRARGYAPLPVDVSGLLPLHSNSSTGGANSQVLASADSTPINSSRPGSSVIHYPLSIIHCSVLAFGAHQKCAAALSVGSQVIVSQHIGDLDTAAAIDALRRVTVDLPRLYDLQPDVIACDMHPDYASTRLAHNTAAATTPLPAEIIPVQHHYAHVLSCMAENELTGAVLGVAWDGTGYGLDHTVWGGEFLLVDDHGFERVGHLRPFLLPGGEAAVKEPRRTALAVLHDIYGEQAFAMPDLAPISSFTTTELGVLKAMLAQKLNTPVTTSAGRLFDAVAAVIGIRQKTSFEGQAAMLLEYAAHAFSTDETYPIRIDNGPTGGGYEIDWRETIRNVVDDVRRGRPKEEIAAVFHNTLVEAIVEMVTRVGCERIALTGGCFQNRYLTERTVQRLREAGLRPYWHQRIPPNDGGITLGQIVAAMRQHAATSLAPKGVLSE